MRDRNQPSVILELLRASHSWRSISPTWLGAPGGFVEQLPQTDVKFDSAEIECVDLPCSGSPTSGSSLLCNLNRIRRWLHPAKWFMPRATVPPSMHIYVEPGIAYWGGCSGSPVTWLGGTSGSFAHNSDSNPRIDLLYLNALTGALGIQQGVPAPSPVPPWPLSGSPFPIAEVYMRPCSGSIFNLCSSGSGANNYIYRDVRPFISCGFAGDGGGGGVTDHGDLGGLADDDHTQYLLTAGTRTGSTAAQQSFGATGLKADVISESTGAAGVTVDSVNLKDGTITSLAGDDCILVRVDKDGDGDYDGYTSTDWNGDSFSTGFGTINWNTKFGVPTSAKMVFVMIMCRDSDVNAPANGGSIQFKAKNTTTQWSLGVSSKANDIWDDIAGWVPVAADGTSYYGITASGANTCEIYIRVIAYAR